MTKMIFTNPIVLFLKSYRGKLKLLFCCAPTVVDMVCAYG